MFTQPERNDRQTLGAIARQPGIKRRSAWVVKASVTRLIKSGLVEQPSTNGKLFLSEAGKQAVADAGGADALRNSW